MKFILGIVALCIANPLVAAPFVSHPRENCEADAEVGVHIAQVQRMLDDLRAGKSRSFKLLVPGSFKIFGVDFTTEPTAQTSQQLTAKYLKTLLSSASFRVDGRRTTPFGCGSVVVFWSRPADSEPYWMTSLVFQGGKLAYAADVDLNKLGRKPPVIVSSPGS